MGSDPVRLFDVELTVTGKVPAGNAGDAIALLCEAVRSGLGPDDPDIALRPFNATIAHGSATTTAVVIPERRP